LRSVSWRISPSLRRPLVRQFDPHVFESECNGFHKRWSMRSARRRPSHRTSMPVRKACTHACPAVADDPPARRAYRACSVGCTSADVARERSLATITFPCNRFAVRAFATRRLERLRDPFPDSVNL
jgi:hypothetical protein